MTGSIEDVGSLPGTMVTDQEATPIGEITEIYAIGGDGQPMWVTVEAKFGMGDKRTVFIPLARLKDEDGTLRVPYSKDHIGQCPDVDGRDGISPEHDRTLRDHYGIDRADQELRSDNHSYATLIPEQEGAAERVEDTSKLETPNPDKRSDETKERLHNPGSSEIRHVDAGAIADQNAAHSGGESRDEQ
jgi:PRC-barrel domain protein